MRIFSSLFDTTITSVFVILSNNGGERIHLPKDIHKNLLEMFKHRKRGATFDQPPSLFPTVSELVSTGRSELMMSRAGFWLRVWSHSV